MPWMERGGGMRCLSMPMLWIVGMAMGGGAIVLVTDMTMGGCSYFGLSFCSMIVGATQ